MFKVPENLDSKYRFVTLSALRAEQLQVCAQPRVTDASHKHTIAAQEEVAAGLVEPWDPVEAEAMATEEAAEVEGEE